MIVQHFFQKHKYILLAAAIMLGVGWSVMMVRLIINYIHLWQMEHMEIVELRAPAPAMQLPMVQPRSRRNTLVPMIMPMTKQQSSTAFPVAAMEGTMVKMTETSAATPMHVGGGIAPMMTGQGNSTTTNSNIALNNSVMNFTGMIYLHTAHSAVTAVGALEAKEVAGEKMGIIAQKNDFPDPPDGPLEPEDPTPIGATPWIVMVLLAGGYAAYQTLRRKSPQIKATNK